MNSQLGRRYVECTAFVLLWLAAEFYFHLTPLQNQFLGIPLILLFQVAIARRPVAQLWAFDATRFRMNARVVRVAVLLAGGCALLLWLGRGTRAAGLGDRLSIGVMAATASIPAAFAISQQQSRALRRALWLAIAGVAVRVGWHAAWPESSPDVIFPLTKLLDFVTLLVCEFTGLFLFDEVAFRGALDPHLARASTGRSHAFFSAVFVSMLWAIWHLRAYNPHVKTFLGLFAAISPFALMQVVLGTLLAFCARTSRTLVPSSAAHACCNAYILALIK